MSYIVGSYNVRSTKCEYTVPHMNCIFYVYSPKKVQYRLRKISYHRKLLQENQLHVYGEYIT
jgi:hypothetical protein